jgi:NADPH:quinone reductase-like Zn-dependent oxidoreductase
MSQVPAQGLQLLSTLGEDGRLTIEVVSKAVPTPRKHEVLIRVEAAPINPSDLALLFGPADLASADYSQGKVVAAMPPAAQQALKARAGQAMPVGNEGAGTVVAAGTAPEAQALVGTRVTTFGGGMYAQYRIADARTCMELPEGVSAEQGAAAFVNPLTALGFVETMRREGHSALVHTAAASNLGQMLARICKEDGVPLVNIVRSGEQVCLLKDLGAEHVVDSTEEGFSDALFKAVAATRATIGFDAIGGGKLAGQLFTAMERVASAGAAFTRYGSTSAKQVYIYGGLDTGPTILNRNFGFSWSLGGWLLTPFLARIGEHGAERLRQRVRDGLTTTFASTYKAKVTLSEMLSSEAVAEYNAKRTGEKYLVLPNG